MLPVHKAVMQNDTDVEELEILIKAHPECLYETNVEGQCPLHLAVVGKNNNNNNNNNNYYYYYYYY